VLRKDNVSVNRDYAAAREDSRMDDVRETFQERRRKAKIDPGFINAVSKWIKPKCPERQERIEQRTQVKRAWEELNDARY